MNNFVSALNDENIFNKISMVLAPYFNDYSDFKHFIAKAAKSASQNSTNILTELKDVSKIMPIKANSFLNEQRLDNIIKNLPQKDFQSYLDFGCSDGLQTDYFVDHLNISKTNAFGIDTELHDQSNKSFTELSYNGNKNIPLPDNSIDLITSMMVLHHVDDLTVFIDDIYRVLNKGGIFFVRETDLMNWSDFLFNHSMELIYYKILTNAPDNAEPLFLKPMDFWKKIFQRSGFSILNIDEVETWNHFNPVHFYLQK
jgi:SAM-dependent methyltransferase